MHLEHSTNVCLLVLGFLLTCMSSSQKLFDKIYLNYIKTQWHLLQDLVIVNLSNSNGVLIVFYLLMSVIAL